MTKYEALLADATQLSVAERIESIEALWDSVSKNSQPGLSDEWLAEIRRRSAEYESGKSSTVPWDAIKTDAVRRLVPQAD